MLVLIMCLDGTKDFPFPLRHFVCNQLVDEQYLETEKKKKKKKKKNIFTNDQSFPLRLTSSSKSVPSLFALTFYRSKTNVGSIFFRAETFAFGRRKSRDGNTLTYWYFVKYSGNRLEILVAAFESFLPTIDVVGMREKGEGKNDWISGKGENEIWRRTRAAEITRATSPQGRHFNGVTRSTSEPRYRRSDRHRSKTFSR